MEPRKYLRRLLRRRQVATMEELQDELKGRSRISVFRDLKELEYYSSYSHAGKYYTLREVARFDEKGLWSYEGVCFSRYGTLKETVFELVENSEAGYRHEELHQLLQVRVHNTLLDLVKEKRLGRIGREKWYLYVSGDKRRVNLQRQEREGRERLSVVPVTAEIIIEILAEVIRGSRICVELNELTRRLVKRGVRVAVRQVAQVLERYGVKKTLVSK